MRKVATRFSFTIILMLVGLLGRLVSGSIPIPPNSPFSAPELHFFAQTSDFVAHHASSSLPVIHVAKSGKKHSQATSGHSRPWYGVLDANHDDDALKPSGPHASELAQNVPTPHSQTNLRPPSC